MATLNKFGVPIDGATGRGGFYNQNLNIVLEYVLQALVI